MDDDQQGVHFYQALVTQGVLQKDLEENPEGGPALGQQVRPEMEPEEYVVTDYKYDKSDWQSDEGKDVKEARNEPHLAKAPSHPRTIQRGDAYHLRSLEEEIKNLKRQLFETEARVVRAD
ncbi:unnamed protein product [Lactuca saligna]|uniref:Uncharacterized protein n=1 Tax=Lactuca saligna TaxID=75948 RepID=A0AA35ZJ95_LACSI|nr:unnamed protein product [Lactuca saligna]